MMNRDESGGDGSGGDDSNADDGATLIMMLMRMHTGRCVLLTPTSS